MADTQGSKKGLFDSKIFDLPLFISALALFAYFWQACIMRQTMRTDERAWVGFDTPKSFTLEPDKPFEITIPLRNTGKTPATQVSGGIGVNIFNIFDRPDLDKLLEPYINPPFALMIPSQTNELTAELVDSRMIGGGLPEEWLKRISNPNGDAITVFGKVTYRDIFGFDHWTRYCYQSAPDPIHKFKFRFENCRFYSGIDDNKE